MSISVKQQSRKRVEAEELSGQRDEAILAQIESIKPRERS